MRRHHVVREIPWIEAVDHTNTARAVTPLEVLTEPQAWRAVQYANPMHTAVAYRFLAALHLASLDGGGGIEAYVDEWNHRFWLEDTEGRHPFGQQPLLADTLSSVEALNSVHSLDATRNAGGPLLWYHDVATEAATYTAAEATLMLLSAQAATPAGLGKAAILGSGKQAQRSSCRSNPAGPIAMAATLIPYPANLEDLLLGLEPFLRSGDADAPLWERDDDLLMEKTTVAPTGPMEWLTWPGLQILLGHTASGLIDRAVAVPGWYPEIDTATRAAIDPFCAVAPHKKDAILAAASIPARADSTAIPSWIDQLRVGAPVSVGFIGQSLTQAKVTGFVQRLRHLPGQAASIPAQAELLGAAPSRKEDSCQPSLF